MLKALAGALAALIALTVAAAAPADQTEGAHSTSYREWRTVMIAQDEPPAERIRLTVTPSTARVGRRTRFDFRATVRSDDRLPPRIDCSGRTGCTAQSAREPVSDAVVRFAGASARTDASGRATITRTLRRPGAFTARATKPGLRAGTARVRATRGGRRGGRQCDPQRGANNATQQCRRVGAGG